jgi:signal transduction histidine kinase
MINRAVTKRFSIASALILAFWIGGSWPADGVPGPLGNDALVIQSVTVQGKTLRPTAGEELSLGASPENVTFYFGPNPSNRIPMRVRCKLDGYDAAWNVGGGFMYLEIRFVDDAGEQVDFKSFKAQGDSTGWNGTLESSVLTHRRETVVVPPRATHVQILMSSAGPPATVGIYVVDDLELSKVGGTGQPSEVLLRAPVDGSADDNRDTQGWIRDGLHPQMAKIIELARYPKTKAFALLDDDPFGHAEWCNSKGTLPRVTPGDNLVLDWNELFSVGIGDTHVNHYEKLPPGKYQFHVEETEAFGGPPKAQVSLAILVPLPFWQMPWFWATMAALAAAASTASVRYATWHKMRRSMARLEQQRVLEQERLRIAQDIHDDLGARVTQISLVSALAQSNATSLEGARREFDRISRMSRDLVSALYETVWAVNPENDNLDAMGNYLCQKINEFCAQAQLRCRLHVVDLPRHVPISSQTRHNISMAVKEALHNILKHALASLVTVRVTYANMLLTVSIQDDGCGFDAAGGPSGNGLVNMRRRLEDIGGSCLVQSSPGRGTTVRMRLVVKLLQEDTSRVSASLPPAKPPEPPPEESQPTYEKVSRDR